MKAIWVHADCLHRESAAYVKYPDAPSVFVWDVAELQRSGWSLKRIGFVYECLLDLPVRIRQGDPVVEVRRFASELGCEGVVTVETVDPLFRRQAGAMGAEVLTQRAFVDLKGAVDLTRFSRYWRKAERAL